MKLQFIFSLLLVATIASEDKESTSSSSEKGCFNLEVNFANAGAMTTGGNRVLESAGGLIQSPALAAAKSSAVATAGLELIGIPQQVSLAKQTVLNRNRNTDLYLLQGGGNDYFGPGSPLTAEVTASNMKNILNSIYTEIDAKYIVLMGTIEPCKAPACGYLGQLFPGLGPALAQDSAVWSQKYNDALKQMAEDFNKEHSDATVIFVDIESKIAEVLGAFPEATKNIDCKFVLYTPSLQQFFPNINDVDEEGFYKCDGFAWTDQVHPTSVVYEQMAAWIVDEVEKTVPGKSLRRMISIGDSYTDLGTLKNALVRTAFELPNGGGNWADVQFADPARDGIMAQNGKSLVEFIEEGLGLPASRPYLLQSSLAGAENPVPMCP